MSHDRRIDQHIERFGGQRAEGRQGESQDLAIMW
jgi:hypothetical protein